MTVGSADDTADAEENLKGIAEEFAENIGEAAESYAESAQNIEDGFGHETYQSEELREKSEAIKSWADDVSSYDTTAYEEDLDCDECGEDEFATVHTNQDAEEHHDFLESATDNLDDWLDEQQGNLLDLIVEVPV